LGLARQGKALARYLAERGAAVVISDLKQADQLTRERRELADLSLEYELGSHPNALLEGTDRLFLSGGVPANIPLAQKARHQGIPVTNDSQVFLEACPARTVGITGSAGKSTTTALVGEISKRAGRISWVGGNIGRPLLKDLSKMSAGDEVILELSSFQLELMTVSPDIAAILNLTPNHLERHKNMEAYIEAKARILQFQNEEDTAVLGHGDPVAWGLRDRVRGRLFSFGLEEPPEGEGAFLRAGELRLATEFYRGEVIQAEEIGLRGDHNLLNALAACAIAAAMDLPVEAMAEALRRFSGLPHRLEWVRTIGDARWVNDSIATTPERAAAGLRSFRSPVVLLAGGRDKGLDWSPLAQAALETCRHVIGFGECGSTVVRAMHEARGESEKPGISLVDDLEQGVAQASELAQSGDVVLLSPGGTSFDAYVDFEARGEHFRELVKDL
ncbi:MAG: UDP-N-acetylmuramoyl-L-alanine--D-glutamate ligase, partial [Anaerolineales bacterium]